MADLRTSELPEISALAGVDILGVVQNTSGTYSNKKITVANILANIATPVICNVNSANIDFQVKGQADSNLIFAKASSNSVGIGVATPTQKLDVVGGLKISGVLVNDNSITQTAAGTIDLTKRRTIFSSVSNIAVTLSNGTAGQYVTLLNDNSGQVTLTAASSTFAGFTSILMTGVGSTVNLEYINSKWYVTGSRNCTIA